MTNKLSEGIRAKFRSWTACCSTNMTDTICKACFNKIPFTNVLLIQKFYFRHRESGIHKEKSWSGLTYHLKKVAMNWTKNYPASSICHRRCFFHIGNIHMQLLQQQQQKKKRQQLQTISAKFSQHHLTLKEEGERIGWIPFACPEAAPH